MFSSLYHIYNWNFSWYLSIYICILDFHFLQKKNRRLWNSWYTSSRQRWLWERVQVSFELRQGNRADDASDPTCWFCFVLHIVAIPGKLKGRWAERIVACATPFAAKFCRGIRVSRAVTITVLSPTTSVNLGISSVFKKVSILTTTRLSITGSTWSSLITAQSCSTRTRLSVTSRRIRSWYLQKKVPKGLLRA